MALTRKFLKSLDIEDEVISKIIEAHTSTTDALKETIADLEGQVSKAGDVAKKLEAANKELENIKADDYKAKYEKAVSDLKELKDGNAKAAIKAEKENAYKALLKEMNVSEKRIQSILKVTDLESVDFKEGKFTDSEKLKENIKNEWSDFIVSEKKSGVNVPQPSTNTGGKTMTKSEIMAITDTKSRQQAIAENPQAFGIE